MLVGVCLEPAASLSKAAVPVQVSAGGSHSCARFDDGTISCWGGGTEGQLGNGTATNSPQPVLVKGITSAIDISAGGLHTCAVLADHTVECWGYNTYGALGNGTFQNQLVPVPVTGLSNAVSVSSGDNFTCAVLADGTVSCWGTNSYRQLGRAVGGPTPQPVEGLSGATQVSAGNFHACATLTDATARCWGSDRVGQLGDGLFNVVSPPELVSGLTGVTQVSAGTGTSIFGQEDAWEHSCARSTSGVATCWGSGDWGKLGDGSANIDRHTPVSVRNLDNVKQIAAGMSHTCALQDNGSVSCWGYNAQGQVGSGVTDHYYLFPQQVPGLTNAVQLSSSAAHSCTLHSDGSIKCWGDNAQGQLGDGTTTNRIGPVCVLGTGTSEQGCSSLPPPGLVDSAGDGIPDAWKLHGITVDAGGITVGRKAGAPAADFVDLPAMGASPGHKDVFVQIDSAAGFTLDNSAIAEVQQAFADAPVANPDGSTGIDLHVDNGPQSFMDYRAHLLWGALSAAHAGLRGIPAAFGSVGTSGSYSFAAAKDLRDGGLLLGAPVQTTQPDGSSAPACPSSGCLSPARREVFRYALSIATGPRDDNGNWSSGIGKAIPGGPILVVALGAFLSGCDSQGTLESCGSSTAFLDPSLLAQLGGAHAMPFTVQAGTFMHELGHTLGLGHNGDQNAPNNNPVYPSVMNYSFQFGALPQAGQGGRSLVDYSSYGSETFDVLDEAKLNEQSGLTGGHTIPASLAGSKTFIHCPFGWDDRQIGVNVDFNCDGLVWPFGTVAANLDGNLSGAQTDLLRPFNDWAFLGACGTPCFSGSGTLGRGQSVPTPNDLADVVVNQEPTVAQLEAPLRQTEAVPTIGTDAAAPSDHTAVLTSTYAQGTGTMQLAFLYGVNDTLGSATQPQPLDTVSGSVSATITNLLPNTTYSYRALLRTARGIQISGAVKTFRTLAGPAVPQPGPGASAVPVTPLPGQTKHSAAAVGPAITVLAVKLTPSGRALVTAQCHSASAACVGRLRLLAVKTQTLGGRVLLRKNGAVLSARVTIRAGAVSRLHLRLRSAALRVLARSQMLLVRIETQVGGSRPVAGRLLVLRRR